MQVYEQEYPSLPSRVPYLDHIGFHCICMGHLRQVWLWVWVCSRAVPCVPCVPCAL